jgi:hypothetical protein
MAIRPSRASELTRLIDELSSGDALRRDSAAARLAIAGASAAPRLAALVADAGARSDARVAALGALAAINLPRAAEQALAAAGSADAAVALDAIDVLADVVHGDDDLATQAFERLTELALDRQQAVERRLAAIGALEGLPDRLMRPVYETLAGDESSRVVARMVRRQAGVMWTLEEIVDHPLPDQAEVMAAIVRDSAETAPVTVLQKAIDLVRRRESDVTDADREGWRLVRGRLHALLADRGSQLALYDLRETLERQAASPLPVSFLAAAAKIGDVSCLEPLAAAWVAAASGDRWWRDHLAEVFAAIVTREGLTRQHPTLRKILTRAPSAGVLVASAPRAKPRTRP